MTDFRLKGESLWWDFIIPTTWHSDCLGFPFEFALCALLLQNIVEQSHSSNGWLSVHSVWVVGVCLHKLQFTPEGAVASQVGELC